MSRNLEEVNKKNIFYSLKKLFFTNIIFTLFTHLPEEYINLYSLLSLTSYPNLSLLLLHTSPAIGQLIYYPQDRNDNTTPRIMTYRRSRTKEVRKPFVMTARNTYIQPTAYCDHSNSFYSFQCCRFGDSKVGYTLAWKLVSG